MTAARSSNMNNEDETPQQAAKAKAIKKANRIKYKKAPGAPRRFKSAYMFFSTEKHRLIREELSERGESEKTTSIAKMVSKAWKNLSQSERDSWEERASQDKARYEVEKTMYTGPWKVPAKKRTAKDPNAPKRPMSAFLSFSHAKRSEVKEANPNMTNAEISRVLAQHWKDASSDDKKAHIDQEFSLRQEYKSAIAIWRENSERELFQQRKVREDMALRTVAANKSGAALHTDNDDTLHANAPDTQAGGPSDAAAYSYPVSQHSQYPSEYYTSYGGAPHYFPPYPQSGAGADPREGSSAYPSNDGYGGVTMNPYGFYPPYGNDVYGPPGYGAYGAGAGGGHPGSYNDYPSSGQPGLYPPYYGVGQDTRYGQGDDTKWTGANPRSPSRNQFPRMPQGRKHS